MSKMYMEYSIVVCSCLWLMRGLSKLQYIYIYIIQWQEGNCYLYVNVGCSRVHQLSDVPTIPSTTKTHHKLHTQFSCNRFVVLCSISLHIVTWNEIFFFPYLKLEKHDGNNPYYCTVSFTVSFKLMGIPKCKINSWHPPKRSRSVVLMKTCNQLIHRCILCGAHRLGATIISTLFFIPYFIPILNNNLCEIRTSQNSTAKNIDI